MVLYYSGMANTPVTSLRIPEDLKERAQELAERDGRSLSNWIVRLIREKVEAAAEKRRR